MTAAAAAAGQTGTQAARNKNKTALHKRRAAYKKTRGAHAGIKGTLHKSIQCDYLQNGLVQNMYDI